MTATVRHFRKALWLALEHDMLNTAKAAAYSGMLALFPALVVFSALLARAPEGTTLVGEIRTSFEQFLPADSLTLLQSLMQTRRIYSTQLIFSAACLSLFAALGVMLFTLFHPSLRRNAEPDEPVADDTAGPPADAPDATVAATGTVDAPA